MLKKMLAAVLCLLILGVMVSCDDTVPPEAPTQPDASDESTDSTPPSEPSEPDEPSNPSDPENPSEPSEPSEPEEPTPPATPDPVWLNIATYNIAHGEEGLTNIIKLIKDEKVDICGLNEVDRNMVRSSGLDQPKYMAEKLTRDTGEQYYWAFAAALDGYSTPFDAEYAETDGKAQYGNAIISKYPIVSARTVLISMREGQLEDNYERRALLIAEIKVNDKILTVISSHFDNKTDARSKAVDLIQQEMATITTPVVVMGDFNDGFDSDCIARLAGIFQMTSPGPTPYTFIRNGNPAAKIDWIFTSQGMQFRNLRVPDVRYSDHLPVFVELYWE